MPLTLGMTGMDSATEAALKAAFEQANPGGGWKLLPEADADHVVVDMDSMYGPMSWLRLHAAGKRVIGLTSAPRTQTDYHLVRPFDAASLGELLQSITHASGAPAAPAPATVKTKTAAPPAAAASVPSPSPAPSGMAPAPQPQDQLPEEQPEPVSEESRAPLSASALPASVEAGTLSATTIAPTQPQPAPPAPPLPPPAPPRERRLGDWLAPGALSGRLRYTKAGQSVLIDADARQYHGPALLKQVAGLFVDVVERGDFMPVSASTWHDEAAALGAAQPLNRLQWYGGLVAGNGELLPGLDPSARYKLNKWPQTEREFPKHFRIATAMMKGPAMLDEIASASGVPLADVADFLNASMATGFAEPYREPEPEPEPQKTSGLFGRLRGK